MTGSQTCMGVSLPVPILTNCIILVFNLCSSLNGHPNRSGSCVHADAEDWISFLSKRLKSVICKMA